MKITKTYIYPFNKNLLLYDMLLKKKINIYFIKI